MRVVLEKPVRAAIFIWADEVVAHVPATPCLRLKSIFWSCWLLFWCGRSRPGHVRLEGLQLVAGHSCHLWVGATGTPHRRRTIRRFLDQKLNERDCDHPQPEASCPLVPAPWAGGQCFRASAWELREHGIGRVCEDLTPVCLGPVHWQLEGARFGQANGLNHTIALATVVACTGDEFRADPRPWRAASFPFWLVCFRNGNVTKNVLAGPHIVTSLCTLLQVRRPVLRRHLRVDLPQFGFLCPRHRDLSDRACRPWFLPHPTWNARCQHTSHLAWSYVRSAQAWVGYLLAQLCAPRGLTRTGEDNRVSTLIVNLAFCI